MYNNYYIACRTLEEYKAILVYLYSLGYYWRSRRCITDTFCYFDAYYGAVESDRFLFSIDNYKLTIINRQNHIVQQIRVEATSIISSKRPSLYKARE
jgi:hypothetical protein